MEAGNMDDSVVSYDQGIGILGSSVLLSMDIRVNKYNADTRLQDVLERFNETYLEAMDFLTQILPLAREQFGRSDNLLLPKTPSKKRHRKFARGAIDKENTNPVVYDAPDESLPVKRVTRSSTRRNNSETQIQELPVRTRNTGGRKKKSSEIAKSGQSTVTFVEDSNIQIADKVVELPPEKNRNETTSSSNTLKRVSSTSPDSIKPVKKKSKSSDEYLTDEEHLSDEKTSTPVSSQPPQTLEKASVSVIAVTSEEQFNTKEVVSVPEENKTTQLTSEEEGLDQVESMDVGTSESNVHEPSTNILVEIDNSSTCNRLEGASVVYLASQLAPRTPPPPKVCIKPEIGMLVDFDQTVDRSTNEAEATSPVTIKETPEKVGNEVVNELVQNSPVTVDSTPVRKEDLGGNTENAIQENKLISPVEVKTLRRSKRISKQISSVEICEALPRHIKEKPRSLSNDPRPVDEESSDSQEEAAVFKPAKTKALRHSTRLSRRVSRVSTGLYNRRSSRRSGRSSANFKKPLPPKQIEVCIYDIGVQQIKADDKAVSSNSEQSSTESDNENLKVSDKSVFSSSATPQRSFKTDSSCGEISKPSETKVAGLVQIINSKALKNEQSSMCKTPTALRKVKRLGSAVPGSSNKLSNLVGGNVRSFIKQQSSVKRLDPNEVVRKKKLELQRKEERERELKDQAKLRRKNWAEEQKRKRQEKQKRVAEAKAAREREEQDKKQRQLEERKQMAHALEQARKKREHEEETKRRLREQRTREAESRRFKEKEERLKRLQEKENGENMYREMLRRKQEQEEQERKQRIQEEKRLNEQKQRERAREKEEERERKLREIKEREAKRIEKEEVERKQIEEMERKEKEDKERKQKEQEEREKKRIAQLIKEKMEQEKKSHEEKLKKEEKERREREEQRKREANRLAMLQAAKNPDSYLMTPPPAQTRKPPTSENYDISDIRSDESTDDEDAPRKKAPYWAQGQALKAALLQQDEPRRKFEDLASGFVPHAPDLEKIFTKKRKRFYQRTSSAHWSSPPIKI